MVQQQQVVAVDGLFERRVDPQSGQNSLHATQLVKRGTVFGTFSARTTSSRPTMYTLQASETEHIDLSPEILSFANHSCKPNFFFNTSDRVMEALEDIHPGDALTFFYPSTEYDMDCPFSCYCKNPGCLGTIQGAKHIDSMTLARYRLNAHVRRMLEKEHAAA